MPRVGFFTVGYLFKTDCAVGYEAGKVLSKMGFDVIELSGDVLTMLEELKRQDYEVYIILGAVKRGRPLGYVESYEFKPRPYGNFLEANDALRPSLSGRISLEDLLTGLNVFGVEKKIYIVECEPPNTEVGLGLSEEGRKCVDRLVEEALKVYKYVST
ncbi:MAG: Ni,Fe-hydrogenase maturation factor [Pyrobaculum sp.]